MKRGREEEEGGEGVGEEGAIENGSAHKRRREVVGVAVGGEAQQQQHKQQEEEAGGGQQQGGGGAAAAAPADEDDDDAPLLARYKMSSAQRRGAECPYLDTISRQVRGRRGGGKSRRAPPLPSGERSCAPCPPPPPLAADRTWILILKSAAR